MRQIISDIIEMLRGTTDLIQFEEEFKLYMFETMSEALGDVLTEINQTMKKNRCDEGWKNVHTDSKTVNFSFGPVTYRHTLIRDGRGTLRHPLNEWLGIAKHQRHSALVEVKVAEMATEMDYRETARVLKEWTALAMSHSTVANSDGGVKYGEEHFKTTFSQSDKEVLCQIDKYHVCQALIWTFGAKESDIKTHIKKAIEAHDYDQFILWMDTYESTEEDPEKLKLLSDFKTHILKHWHQYFDWRDKATHVPDGARTLGAMESNQCRVSYPMKERGMHWSQAGALGMVKLLQARANKMLRASLLAKSIVLLMYGFRCVKTLRKENGQQTSVR